MPDAAPPPGPPRWDRRGLQVRAFLLVAVGLLVPVALLGELGRRGVVELSGRVLTERQLLAQSLAAQIEERFNDDFAKPDAFAPGGSAEALAARVGLLLRQYRRSDGVALDLIDSAGAVLASSDHGSEVADDVVTEAPVALTPWHLRLRQRRKEAFAAAEALERRMLVLIPVFLGLAAFFTWGAVRSVRKPLSILTSAAERVAAGDLGRPIPPLPEDEVGRLGGALEAMRAALASSLEEIQRTNAGLEERVVERTRALERLYDELKDRDARRAKLVRKLLSAQEDERRRIARELHDETCQTVAALSVGLDTALKAPSPEAGRERLEEVRRLATRTLDDLHRVIFDLRPSMLDDLGLVPAIRWYVERSLSPLGIAVRCEIEGLDERLPPEVEIPVFRAVQEALTNVARHAEARSVLIQMTSDGRTLSVEIEDDGRGFEPESVAKPSESGQGLGLLGIRERVEILGGTIAIDSAPGEGTRVAFRVPLPEGG
jgi:signal transduction histidine kinase